jgi:hypothetical protein
MLQPIEGYFDGKYIVPLSEIKEKKHYKVKITFLEELSPEDEIRLLSSHSEAFDFWNDPKEDIYQDYLPNS